MRPRFAAVLLAAGFVAGCSSHSADRTEVTGKVTRNGIPVTEGLVTFHGPNGQQATGGIRPSGEYTVSDPPSGTCLITVKPIPGVTTGAGHGRPGPGERAKPSPIPRKYENPGNGLSHDVKPGIQTHDLELTP